MKVCFGFPEMLCRRITLQVSYFRGVGSPVLVQYVYPATYLSLHTLEILYCENLSVILLSDYAPVILCIFFSSIFVDPCCCWPIFLNCYRIQKLWEAPLVRGSVFMIQIKEYIFFLNYSLWGKCTFDYWERTTVGSARRKL